MPRTTSILVLLLLSTLAYGVGGAPLAEARVLNIEIERRAPILDGASFEGGITYELIEGRVHFGFDPTHPANQRISDLELAPKGESGLVEAWSEFVALQPIDPEERSGTAIVDVPNRGRRLLLAGMNRVQREFMAPAILDPASAADWGDGFLMSRGLTLLWVGWQADAPDFPGSMRLRVPRATQPDGSPIRGLARSDWVVDEAKDRLPLAALGHAPHVAAEPDSPDQVLTRRRGRETERTIVPREAWRFDETREGILLDGGFEPGWIYELVYVAEAPPLVGLGFAAFRDFAAYAESDPDCPFPVERSVAYGLSQSGRFLRHFLYEGFNRDESGRVVFEAMMIQIGGAGRGGFNHRFSHPGRVGNPYANFFYPGDQFPFTSRPTRMDEESNGERAGLLDRVRADGSTPKIFQINTGYEYWGRGASLIHMTTDGARDVEPVDEERLYHVASAPHYSLPFPPRPESQVRPGLFAGSSVDTSGIGRALLVRLLDWTENGVEPPPSTIPTIAGGTLVEAQSLEYPIAWLERPRSPHVAYRVDYGPDWSRGIIGYQPPRRGAAFAIRVPRTDALGSEASGIRAMELRVPIGTYTPWSLRWGKAGGADEMAGYIGSFLPLATRPDARQPGDARPALSTLYPTRDAYETAVVREIDALVEAGWMLARDRVHAFEAATARWDWITTP